MAQFVVRNIENIVKVRLQRRARRHGHSMEEEARRYPPQCCKRKDIPVGGLGTEISALFAKVGLDSDIQELQGHEIKPASFES